MIFEWESERQRLRRFMNIPPVKKLEWLRQMNEFLAKFTPEKSKMIRKKLKEKQA
jgi:hypothetical protein